MITPLTTFVYNYLHIELNYIQKSEREVIMEENPNGWKYGFNISAESWNGRLAMIGFVSVILIELLSGQGVLHFWGIL